MKPFKISVQFLILTFLFSISLQSQPNDTIQLGEVRVISSILDMRQRQSGRSVTIITAEQIRQTPASSIDEIIRYIPGLETQSRNLYGVQTDFSIRGSTFNQVLVMIDGMRLNDPLTGHFNSYIPIPLSEVSRIEVIRGPATVMYGPDAVGGVVNIITNNYILPADSTNSLSLSVGGGAHDLFHTDAGFNRSYVKWQFGGGFRLLSSSGFPSDEGFKDDFNLRAATASFSGMVGERTRISFRTAIDSREFSARRFYTISPADTAREEVLGWWNHFSLFHSGHKSATTMDMAFKSGSDEYRFNLLSASNSHTTNQLIVQLRNNRDFGENLRMVAGIHTNYRTIESNDRGNHHEFFGGIYSLAFLSLPGDVFLSGGARLESDRYNYAVFLPHVNISWIKGPLTIRSLAGKTMRTPDFTERYVSTNLPVLSSGRNLGNPALGPEKSWSFEAGSDVNLINGINAGFTIFTRWGYNLIDYILTPAGRIPDAINLDPEGNYFFSRNIGNVNTAGIEMTINGNIFIKREFKIEYNAGYTFQETVNLSGELSKYISNQARQLFIFSSSVTNGRALLGINGVGKVRNSEFAESIGVSLMPSYLLLNLQGSYMIVPETFAVELRVENLFNIEYSDILGARLPGRWVSGGVKIRFW